MNLDYFRRFVFNHYSHIDFNLKNLYNENILRKSFSNYSKKTSTKNEKNVQKVNQGPTKVAESYNPQSKKAKVNDNNKLMSFFKKK